MIPLDSQTQTQTKRDLATQVNCLVVVVRSIGIKIALHKVNPNPKSYFWRVIYGGMLDIAVIEWCKVFGTNDQPTHWKKIIVDKDVFRKEMFSFLEINKEQWSEYWDKMISYRNSYAAHNLGYEEGDKYPTLDIALKSCFFYYPRLVEVEKKFAEIERPESLEDYFDKFYLKALVDAKKALAATNNIER